MIRERGIIGFIKQNEMNLENENISVKKELKEILKSMAEENIYRIPFIFDVIDSYESFIDELIDKYKNNEQN